MNLDKVERRRKVERDARLTMNLKLKEKEKEKRKREKLRPIIFSPITQCLKADN